MAKEQLTTIQDERNTYENELSDAIGLIRTPLKDFLELIDETEGETGRILRVFNELLERQDQEFEKIYAAIQRTLGRLRLEYPMWGECVKYDGERFEHNEIIRAILIPMKPLATAPGGE